MDMAAAGGSDKQPVAQALFAVPFILFSGFAGFVADRVSKRRVVILCKVVEIGVMLLGMVIFLVVPEASSVQLQLLFVALFLMSTQSAFFGPSKYGILPEMLRPSDLPHANGVFQMTTFTAIIFGTAVAGFSKQEFADRLWMVSLICAGIAVIGTATSIGVRRTPVAKPDLKLHPSSFAIGADTFAMLRNDSQLIGVLLVSSLFWFLGGVVQPGVNLLGRMQLRLADGPTSLLVACIGVGIACGCAIAGHLSHQRIPAGLVRVGAWGVTVCLALMLVPGQFTAPPPGGTDSADAAETLRNVWSGREFLAGAILACLGFFAGLFIVPLQVFLQVRPPEEFKGRMIGAMNLVNWIAIVFSAGFLQVAASVVRALELPVAWIFAALAVVMLPVAVWYRPPEVALRGT